MKKILLFILLALPLSSYSQILKERRVYYLDCSFSMSSNKIWDDVCDNLKKAIDNVNDETTELIVVPFALDKSGGIKVYKALATPAGKDSLKRQISAIVPNKSSMTYHKVPLEDFYSNRVDSAKVTYMFLMTDGQDECKNKTLFPNLLSQWQGKYGDKNVFGFYVMLHNSAKNTNIKKICDNQKHLWTVETADININLVRLQSTATFNARNDKYFDLPIYGNYNGKTFKAKFPNNSKLKVKSVSIKNGKLRVYVDVVGKVQALPAEQKIPLKLTMTGGGKFDFLVTEIASVTCLSKLEKSLKISIK